MGYSPGCYGKEFVVGFKVLLYDDLRRKWGKSSGC